MKKISSLLIIALHIAACGWAQNSTPRNSVSLELGGAVNMVGGVYEHRFPVGSSAGAPTLGFRTGLGFVYSESMSMFAGSSDLRGWSVPLELNYLLGRRKNHLEVGAGVNLGLYNEHVEYSEWEYVGQDASGINIYNAVPHRETRNSWGHLIYGNVGWRRQAASGFLIRAGISPSFNLGGSHAISRAAFWPYLSFGWAF